MGMTVYYKRIEVLHTINQGCEANDVDFTKPEKHVSYL